ncbi:MAG: metallophosphoesterase, partial [Sinobacterium sp.]|nr:metallophosphoesterase [Sinobacterium sp.]
MLINSDCQHFDIIGDVHGCGDALIRLLEKMSYQEIDGVYQFVGAGNCLVERRQIIFVGDIIDRGPDILQCLNIVRAMVEAGHAHMVIGNHEFNALAYYTPLNDGFLRERNERSTKQLKATIDAFKGDEALLNSYLVWFSGLPLFLDFEQFRVVHACWDQTRINSYFNHFNTHCLTPEAIQDCSEYSSIAGQAVERLTRGLSLRLPDDMHIIGRDGFQRSSFRVCFWAKQYTYYNDIVFQPDPLPESIRERHLDEAEKGRLIHYSEQEKPLFVGHYWLRGEPSLVANNIACLDYSAVNSGKLVAYRFSVKEPRLDKKNFIFVDTQPSA